MSFTDHCFCCILTMLSVSSLPSTVLLSCPSMHQESSCVMSDSDQVEWGLYQTLQEVLREIGLPKTTHSGLAPGESYSELCFCVLGSPLPHLSFLLEAGQVSPGDSLLCLSPFWVSRDFTSLMVHKAVAFDLGGRTTLLTFSPPRRITYLLTCNPWAGQEVTREVDCPMGGSQELDRFWGDILTTRVLLQKAKINCPPTLALLLPLGQNSMGEGRTGVVEVVLLETEGLQRGTDSVRNKLTTFLESDALRQADRVILRRSRGGTGDKLLHLPRDSREEVWMKVTQILPLLMPGEAILVEAYCPPLKPRPRVEDHTWEQYSSDPGRRLDLRGVLATRHFEPDCRPQVPNLSFRMCATVTRSPQNVPLLYKLECKVRPMGTPPSQYHSISQSLETTMSDLAYCDPSMTASLRRLATDTAQACLQVVMETESKMSPEQRGGMYAQSDVIGVDLLITLSNLVISPVVVGLRPSPQLRPHFLEGGMGGWDGNGRGTGWNREGCLGSLLHSPLARSQCYLMKGKTVLIIGAGGYSKTFVWEAATQYGLKIMLVESDSSHFASRLVEYFFPLPDLPDHGRDDQHCARICEWVESLRLQPDGCVCFWDDCVVLASLVCKSLGLRGAPPEAIHIAKEKSRTHLHLLGLQEPTSKRPGPHEGSQPADSVAIETVLELEGESLRAMMDFDRREKVGLKGDAAENHGNGNSDHSSPSPGSFRPWVPHLSPPPAAYGVPCAHVENAQDLKDAVQQEGVRFPAIMKLEYGAGAVGVKQVGSLEEAVTHLEKIAGDLREETDYPGIGLGWGNAMTLMEFVGGTEHDVDLLLFDGRLEGAFVSDNGPTRLPAFTETAAQMPTGLAPDKRDQLICAAYHSCLACGLRDGVFNVELKMTLLGPRLLEINARMGGFYLRDWILQLYGVDILLAAFMVACGLPPRLPSATGLPPQGHYAGIMCVVSQHRQALNTTAHPKRLRWLHQKGVLRLNELEEELISGEYEEPYCNISVRDSRADDARQRLLALCQGLGLHCPPRYDVGYFLSHFK
ncbi:carnosine synthase 1-like isoform X2 [Conger conger]|uniref:carnosine synthase 1-like isoform X2 n=1 Tax=Conger conger TaxID=82655 RepID=UPI002A59DDF3|nr:carnosine synthase 1-like isoform X2 [Conger conger]